MRICILLLSVGSLYAQQGLHTKAGDCPLTHTTVKVDISGMVARVDVVQDYANPFPDKIEGEYTFPLPHEAAVDRMTMTIGSRVIEGRVRKRAEAQAIYDSAKASGRVASLLHQERPNVFTQAVANIMPGEKIQIRISYVQTLSFEAGHYEFVFPMVVAPRYHPSGTRDAARLSPPVVPEGTRAGHDISLEVAVDAGVPISNVASKTHDVDVVWRDAHRANVKLRAEATIPNKDLILRYESASGTIADAVIAHRSAQGGFFTLVLQPPAKTGAADATPKELIFVLDTSGSMTGFPIEKAKESMKQALAGLYPQDTFNLITFAGDTEILFPAPVPATAENLEIAQLFLQSRGGNGGTEMMKAIRAALDPTPGSGRVRVVCFMTDGEVGNDFEILAEVRKHPDARVFSFGIGSSVNRFLLDSMARLGRGEVEYVGLSDDGSAAARRFHERVRDPLLTDIEIDWGGLPVSDVYPKRIPDLFGAKPVIVTGRYTGPLRGAVSLRGKAGGHPTTRPVSLDLPAAEAGHDALASLWARNRVADLMDEDYGGAHRGGMNPQLENTITALGLEFGIATQFTSFVAVEEQTITTGGHSRKVAVPVNMPEGMSYQGIQGGYRQFNSGVVGGVPGGVTGGVIGGIIGSVPNAAPPLPPPPARAVAPLASMVVTSLPVSPEKLAPALRAMMKPENATQQIEVQVLLTDATAATLKSLAEAGLIVSNSPGANLMLTGRIAVGRLGDLARLTTVRYVVQRKR
jgi:Ca-activated chloride channel family protein